MSRVDTPWWKEACEEEYQSLMDNNVWTVVDLPPGKKAVGSKWVFKLKKLPDGSIDRFKARVVARGFTQKAGIDFTETFAPVFALTPSEFSRPSLQWKTWNWTKLTSNLPISMGRLKKRFTLNFWMATSRGTRLADSTKQSMAPGREATVGMQSWTRLSTTWDSPDPRSNRASICPHQSLHSSLC